MPGPTYHSYEYQFWQGPVDGDDSLTTDLNGSAHSGAVEGDFAVIVVNLYTNNLAPTVEMGDFFSGSYAATGWWVPFGGIKRGDYWTFGFYTVLDSDVLRSSGYVAVSVQGLDATDPWNVISLIYQNADYVDHLSANTIIGSLGENTFPITTGTAIHFSSYFGIDTDPDNPDLGFDPTIGAYQQKWLNTYDFPTLKVARGGFVTANTDGTLYDFTGMTSDMSGIASSFGIYLTTEEPPPEPVVINRPLGREHTGWQYILCNTPDPTDPTGELDEIGELESARGKNLEIVRNRAGSAGCTLSIYDEMTQYLLDKVDLGDIRGTLRKTLLIRRNHVDIWSGPIGTIQGNLQEGGSSLTIGAVGWLEYLFHRELEADRSYTNQPQDAIAFDLLVRANAQEPAHPIPIFAGNVNGFMPNRSPAFKKGDTFGASIQKLSDVESGFDFEVDPRTRELHLYAWDAYTVRDKVKFGLGWGPDNIQKFGWNENGLATRNRLIVSGSANIPISAQDTSSQDEYGLFVETINLPAANTSILPAYANAELVVRSRPSITFSITPKQPTEGEDDSPRLFDDFWIGDQLSMTVKDGYFELENQAIRLFGANISISDDGAFETINSLMLSPAT